MPDVEPVTFSHELLQVIRLVSAHLGGHRTLNELLILVAVWDAETRGEALTISDVARLCDMPTSTASNTVARLGDFAADGIGFITLSPDTEDRRKKAVRPSTKYRKVGKTITTALAAQLVQARNDADHVRTLR